MDNDGSELDGNRVEDATTRWLSAHWEEDGCPVCGYSQWRVLKIVNLPVGDVDRDGEELTIPVVPVLCTHCANIQLFSALTIGALDEDGASDL